MAKTLYWLQGGACGGDSMSLLGLESPSLIELMRLLDLDVLYHPSLSAPSVSEHRELIRALSAGEKQLDILCVEGSVILGPGGTGLYDTTCGVPKMNVLAQLAGQAQYVVAVGTCASFGGIGVGGEIEATGLQFHRAERGGFLGKGFLSKAGAPVINLPGCPCHCDVIAGALTLVCAGSVPPLDALQAPLEWYGMLVHQGCSRNEYHEYRVEERDFGERGCLFFFLGCRGPMAHGPCNKHLWNRRSSKTRVGVPCVGCTRPDFPQDEAFFQTRAIAGVPLTLPEGVDRAHYLAYKDMAAAAAPDRLRKRRNVV